MITYVDSSTLVERALAIASDQAVPFEWDTTHSITSEITVIEICRVLRRLGYDSEVPDLVSSALSSIELEQISPRVISVAAALPVRFLKSLDAIHVSSALLTHVDRVLTNDRQMQRACSDLGIPTASSTNPAD